MPRLIVFEGIDGSGKTTLSKRFCSHLEASGTPAVWLREPSDSPAGENIRQIAKTDRTLPVEEELEYFIADRRWDVRVNIVPALKAGKTVVMDRYFYSNACYQGARGMDLEEILRMNRIFAPEADLVFLIDADPGIGLARIRETKREVAILFEKQAYLEKVRENYLQLGRFVPNLRVIEGNDGLDEVFARIIAAYREFPPLP